MYLQDFIGDKSEVFAHAFAHPAMASKRKPTIETAMKCVVSSIEHIVARAVREKYESEIADAVATYELHNGEYDALDVEQRDDWSSGMDDAMERIFEPIQAHLSADWLARYTIGTHMEEPEAAAKLAEALGKEIFKQLAYGKEPGQVLSNAGILRDDVQNALNAHLAPKSETEKQEMSNNLDAAMQRLTEHLFAQVGNGFDVMEVMADLEGITDDDEILSGSAGQRLGLDEDDIRAAQTYALQHGADKAVEDMMTMLSEYKPGAKPATTPPLPPPPPAPTHATIPAPPTPTPPAAPPPPKADVSQNAASAVLAALKAHSAIGDTEMSQALGVSRSTYIGWTKGKPFAPDVTQTATLRNRLVLDLNGLYAALCALDGVQVDRSFE